MYYKVTDKKNNVFIFKIMKDKNIHYFEKKDNYWRVSNITSGTILIPTFNSSKDAVEYLKGIKGWNIEELDLEKFNMINF